MRRLGPRELGAATIGVAVFWLIVAIYSVYPALPYSPLQLPYANLLNTQLWLPQGWAFFTRDPREDRTLIFVRTNGAWQSAYLAPHARLANLLGLDRASRGQGVEMGTFLKWMNGKSWSRCHDRPVDCLDRIPVLAQLDNKYPHPTLCGTIGLVQQKPVPWAWSRSPTPVVMPSIVVKLEVRCSA
jgi:antimicrobial peptide system SdpA family protein